MLRNGSKIFDGMDGAGKVFAGVQGLKRGTRRERLMKTGIASMNLRA